jgi:hypothetical protein
MPAPTLDLRASSQEQFAPDVIGARNQLTLGKAVELIDQAPRHAHRDVRVPSEFTLAKKIARGERTKVEFEVVQSRIVKKNFRMGEPHTRAQGHGQ